MDTRAPYETLIGKEQKTIIRELEQLIGACTITLSEGGRWLISQRAPDGPIMGERSVSCIYKCLWGMLAAGVDHFYINEMLDWLYRNALRANGDIYFPEESPDHRDSTRVYRGVVIAWVASLIGHPLIRDEKVIRRLLQAQDRQSGGCYYYLGDDPEKPVFPDFQAIAETSFFGEFAISAGLDDAAMKAGAWMVRVAEENRSSMFEQGVFYCVTDRAGKLIREVKPGERFFKTVNNKDANQAGWNIGCAIAFLADLYDFARSKHGVAEKDCQCYLDAAISLLNFENSMPLYTYFYPSKCKVAWGAGTLLRVLIKYGIGSEELFDKLYRVGKRVFVYTFLGSQLPDGSWPAMLYPLSDDSPELSWDYRVLKGLSLRAVDSIQPSPTSSFLPAVEITGEFLGEIGGLLEGLASLLRFHRE